ncbi:MAG: hypothetical protein ACW964_11570 [Candidatus Hodarchaeales archaeon]|jgi:predicted secreted protein
MRKYGRISILMIIILGVIYWQIPNNTEKAEAKNGTTNTTVIEMEWNITFGGTRGEITYSLIQTSDGGFALAGSTSSYGVGGEDCWLVKTDVNGQHEWNNTFGGIEDDRAWSLIQTSDGGFAMTGWTGSYGVGGEDCWLVKTDTNGQNEWNNTFGGIENDRARSLIQTSDGGFALAGWTGSYGTGGVNCWLIKTDANGQHEWNNTFGGTGYDSAWSLIQTSDGGFALAGITGSYGAGGDDCWLVKTDVNGQHEWNNTFGGTGYDSAWSLIQTSDGGFALAGYTDSHDTGGGDCWLVKTDVNGQHEWNNTFGGTGYDNAWSLIQTSDGSFALAGSTSSYGVVGSDLWLVKTDANGQHEWNNTFGGIKGDDGATSLIQTSDGGFVLAGWTSSYGAGGIDIWLVKTISITTNSSPFWSPIIVILSFTLIIFRIRMKHS